MERLCVRVQQQVCVLRGTGEGEELQAARQVLKEARNSRAVSVFVHLPVKLLHNHSSLILYYEYFPHSSTVITPKKDEHKYIYFFPK